MTKFRINEFVYARDIVATCIPAFSIGIITKIDNYRYHYQMLEKVWSQGSYRFKVFEYAERITEKEFMIASLEEVYIYWKEYIFSGKKQYFYDPKYKPWENQNPSKLRFEHFLIPISKLNNRSFNAHGFLKSVTTKGELINPAGQKEENKNLRVTSDGFTTDDENWKPGKWLI